MATITRRSLSYRRKEVLENSANLNSGKAKPNDSPFAVLESSISSIIVDSIKAYQSSFNIRIISNFAYEYLGLRTEKEKLLLSLYNIYRKDYSMFLWIALTNKHLYQRIWDSVEKILLLDKIAVLYLPLLVTEWNVESLLVYTYLRIFANIPVSNIPNSDYTGSSVTDFMLSLAYVARITSADMGIGIFRVQRIGVSEFENLEVVTYEQLSKYHISYISNNSYRPVMNGFACSFTNYLPMTVHYTQLDLSEQWHTKILGKCDSVKYNNAQNCTTKYYEAICSIHGIKYLQIYEENKNKLGFYTLTYAILKWFNDKSGVLDEFRLRMTVQNNRVTLFHDSIPQQDLIVEEGHNMIPIVLSAIIFHKADVLYLINYNGFMDDLAQAVIKTVSL